MTRETKVPKKARKPPVEIELKFRVDDLAAASALLELDRIGPLAGEDEPPREVTMEDRYVDTAAGALTQAGYAVRLRGLTDGTIVSIKSLARVEAVGGASQRDELEGPAHARRAPAKWPPSDARDLLLQHTAAAALQELVTVRQQRRRRLFASGDSTVELSLDAVEVVADGNVIERFTELEAELVKGDASVLSVVAAVLDGTSGIRRATSTKLEAALAALDGARPPIVEPEDGSMPTAVVEAVVEAVSTSDGPSLSIGKTPSVVAEDHVAEAARKVFRFHLARMLDYEAGTRTGEDAEDLHKMRVATRRQRAAWRVFGAAFRPKRTKWRAVCSFGSSIPTATGAGSTTIVTSCAPRARPCCPSGRCSRTGSGTPRRRASGPLTSSCEATRPCCAGRMSRPSTTCASPPSGCATRSSSPARPSGRRPRRSSPA